MAKLTYNSDRGSIEITIIGGNVYVDWVRPNTYANRVKMMGEVLDLVKEALEADRREEAKVGKEDE